MMSSRLNVSPETKHRLRRAVEVLTAYDPDDPRLFEQIALTQYQEGGPQAFADLVVGLTMIANGMIGRCEKLGDPPALLQLQSLARQLTDEETIS
jgi:hypothetical protein